MEAQPVVDAPPARPAWWLRALGRLPLPLMYALAGFVAWLLRAVFRYRVRVVRDNLRGALPELGEGERQQILRRHYRALAEVLFELPRVAVMSAAEVRGRVLMPDMPAVHAELARGRAVLVVTAHQCNWEWLLQALALDLGVPFLAAYKPPHHAGADRLMRALRGRFGVRMVPGKRLVREVLRQRGKAHAIGMVADQMPTSSAGRVWLKFLGRDTAFFPGPAEVARLGGYSATSWRCGACAASLRGALPAPGGGDENLDVPGFTARYAARLEAQIRAHPPTGPGHTGAGNCSRPRPWPRRQPLRRQRILEPDHRGPQSRKIGTDRLLGVHVAQAGAASRGHDLPGAQQSPVLEQVVGEPHHGQERVTERMATAPLQHRLVIDPDLEGQVGQCQRPPRRERGPTISSSFMKPSAMRSSCVTASKSANRLTMTSMTACALTMAALTASRP